MMVSEEDDEHHHNDVLLMHKHKRWRGFDFEMMEWETNGWVMVSKSVWPGDYNDDDDENS